jgi:hypothetical protein
MSAEIVTTAAPPAEGRQGKQIEEMFLREHFERCSDAIAERCSCRNIVENFSIIVAFCNSVRLNPT